MANSLTLIGHLCLAIAFGMLCCNLKLSATILPPFCEGRLVLLTKNFIKFLVIGSFNALICLAVFKSLILCKLNYLVASGLMNIVGGILGYILNAKLVYKAPLSLKQLLKYFNVYALAFILNLGIMYSLVTLLKVADLAAQLLTIAVLTVVNYQLIKLLVFCKR